MSRLFGFLVTISLFSPSFLHPQSRAEAIERAAELNQEYSETLAALVFFDALFQGTLKVDAGVSLSKFLLHWNWESSLGYSEVETGLDEAKYPKFVAFRDEIVVSFVAKPEIAILNSYRLYSPELRAKYIIDRRGFTSVRMLGLEDIDFDGFLLTYPYQYEDATKIIGLTIGEEVTLKINRTDLEEFVAGNITKQEVLRRAYIFIDQVRVEIPF